MNDYAQKCRYLVVAIVALSLSECIIAYVGLDCSCHCYERCKRFHPCEVFDAHAS